LRHRATHHAAQTLGQRDGQLTLELLLDVPFSASPQCGRDIIGAAQARQVETAQAAGLRIAKPNAPLTLAHKFRSRLLDKKPR
jgi:hypothetical protein